MMNAFSHDCIPCASCREGGAAHLSVTGTSEVRRLFLMIIEDTKVLSYLIEH